jgi:Mrp family chromosome partitioning ATPase
MQEGGEDVISWYFYRKEAKIIISGLTENQKTLKPDYQMKIVTITGYKGGVGKSTTAIHLATFFSDLGKRERNKLMCFVVYLFRS